MPTKIKLTQDILDKMVKMRVEQKMSFMKIGQILNLSAQTVTRNLQDLLGNDLEKTSTIQVYDRYFFYDIDTPEKAYWLGFITADGYVNEDRNFLQFHLQWSDKEHLEKFKRAIQAEDRIQVKSEKHCITGNKIATLAIQGKEFVKGLVLHGVRQRKSTREEPPIGVPDELMADYLRGLWDGDGNINSKKINICSSYKMCNWILNFFMKLFDMPKMKIFFHFNTYRLYICKCRYKILEYMYYPCVNKEIVLTRKYQQAKILLLRHAKANKPS